MIVKKGYYRNDGPGLACSLLKVPQIAPFITTVWPGKKLYICSIVLFPRKVARILACECRKTRHTNFCISKVKITGRRSALLSLQTNCIV